MAEIKQTLKQIQKQQSKERILNVSSRLFKKQGFHATGLDQIMSEAALTAGAFYAHFESKQDLFEQTLEQALGHSKKLLTKATENLKGEAKTQAMLRHYCSVGHRDFPEKGCILPALASEIYRNADLKNKKSNQAVETYIEKWALVIAENLAEDLPPDEKMSVALRTISQAVGAVLLSRIVQKTALSERILSAAQKI